MIGTSRAIQLSPRWQVDTPNGSISGAITVQEGGTLAPGSSGIGTLTDTSNVTFAANSHFAIEVGGAAADKLVVGGNLNLSAVEFLDVTGSGAGPWTIATYGGTLTGTFNNVTAGYIVDYSTTGQIKLNLAGVPGDYNHNRVVDTADYVVWRKQKGTTGPDADGNHDNVVDDLDYDFMRARFGNVSGAGSGCQRKRSCGGTGAFADWTASISARRCDAPSPPAICIISVDQKSTSRETFLCRSVSSAETIAECQSRRGDEFPARCSGAEKLTLRRL